MSKNNYVERFDAKTKLNVVTGCLEWTASKVFGYGRCSFKGHRIYTHRLAWLIAVGPIPEKMHVLHKCDNRCCVNPNHLFLGTQLDNVHDAVKKGRHPKGESNGQAKLTENDVLTIRRARGVISQRALANKFNVSQTTIKDAQLKKFWKHV